MGRAIVLLREINEGRKITKNEEEQCEGKERELKRKREAGKASLLQCK